MIWLPLALLACAPKEDAAPALSVTPSALDLGTVGIGTVAEAAVILQNDGGGAIEILSASLVEGDTRAWGVAREGFDPLEGEALTTLTITFSPDEEGASPAQVQIRSDDPSSPSLYVALSGTGGPSTADNDADGYSVADGDCDDGRDEVYPGADEVCDGRDDDCDGTTPADETDADGDGYRLCAEDCDDADPSVHPGAAEICDEKDTDCDGATPDHTDSDGDGYSTCDDDCDDADWRVYPGAVEVCDGADNDCSGRVDDLDADGDGATLCGDLPDCDDADPAAFPVFVDPAVEPGGTGTLDAPFSILADAIDAIGTCREIGLAPGTYTESTVLAGGEVAIYGLAGDPSGVVFTPDEGERAFTVSDGADVTLVDLTLLGGRPAEGDGGAILVTDAVVSLWKVIASNNTSAADGGAVSVSSGSLFLAGDVVFSGNVAGDDGGAVAVVSGEVYDQATTWIDNRATQGGALLAVSTGLHLQDATYEGNSASGDGGAIAIEGESMLSIEHLVLTGNSADGRGGAISLNDVTSPAEAYLRNLVVTANSADEGGGLAFTGAASELIVANNTLVGNTSAGEGAALFIDATDAAGLYVWSNVFAWNDGDSGLWSSEGNGASIGYNLGYATNSGTDFVYGIEQDAGENFSEDPLFTTFTDDGDPDDDDLGLRGSSPAVDSGPPDELGAGGYTSWADVDGSVNDRGHGGGRGGW
ncbi:MAG: MopE-related protein [Pseudomonadota bacterium]|nr:MopE-related protein [Pseudomonadota bacterium]